MDKEKRFVKIYTQGVMSTQEIWQDTDGRVTHFVAGRPVVGPVEP